MSAMDRFRSTTAMRALNKRILNPLMMGVAGRQSWSAAVIRYTGRRSGTAFATPVGADRVEDGFIIPLGYGTETDWLRNVRAAGNATLEVTGETYQVTAPQIIDAATAFSQVSAARSRFCRRMRIEHYLKLSIRTDQS